jgi:hypothetical protein
VFGAAFCQTKEVQWKIPKLQSRSSDPNARYAKRLPESLPISAQQSYFMLTKGERNVSILDSAEKPRFQKVMIGKREVRLVEFPST